MLDIWNIAYLASFRSLNNRKKYFEEKTIHTNTSQMTLATVSKEIENMVFSQICLNLAQSDFKYGSRKIARTNFGDFWTEKYNR